MPPRKSTKVELDQMVAEARALTAKECQSWHPVKGVRCQLEANHAGAHEWRAVAGARPHYWSDAGRTYREPERIRRRGKFVVVEAEKEV